MPSAHARELQKRAHHLIPGGAHTSAKGDDQFPEAAPPLIARGQGCHVWDTDGNEFIEYGMGLRAITLGHGYKPVCDAAYQASLLGTNYTRPGLIELEAAEKFLSVIDADMVKFGKHGSDATTAAVKLARAHTGRDLVAICGDHPFFSVDDWFMGTTPIAAGIPVADRLRTLKFKYNDVASLKSLFAQYPNQIALVVMEAENGEEPKPGYLQSVMDVTRAEGAVFLLDEIITGFRFHLNGAQKFHGIKPDLCSFGKAMANGFAVSALAGKRELMELGGLETDRERVFLLSLTHGADSSGLAAMMATLDAYQREDVIAKLWRGGERLAAGVNAAARSLGIEKYFHLIGRPCAWIYVTKDADGNRSQAFRTLFLQEMLRAGFLVPNFMISAAHSDEDIDRTIAAVEASLAVYAKALTDGPAKFLEGRPVRPVTRRFNTCRPGCCSNPCKSLK